MSFWEAGIIKSTKQANAQQANPTLISLHSPYISYPNDKLFLHQYTDKLLIRQDIPLKRRRVIMFVTQEDRTHGARTRFREAEGRFVRAEMEIWQEFPGGVCGLEERRRRRWIGGLVLLLACAGDGECTCFVFEFADEAFGGEEWVVGDCPVSIRGSAE